VLIGYGSGKILFNTVGLKLLNILTPNRIYSSTTQRIKNNNVSEE
jgi:hypothetical protein